MNWRQLTVPRRVRLLLAILLCALAFTSPVVGSPQDPQPDPVPDTAPDPPVSTGGPLVVEGEAGPGETGDEAGDEQNDESTGIEAAADDESTVSTDSEPEAPTAQPARQGDQDLGELFVRANDAYEEGRYGRAIELYRQLLANGADHGVLHYNLGNAYLRAGELGRAIASYRRSLNRQPRDQDTAANLDFARRSARDALAPPAPSEVQRTLLFWHYSLSKGQLLATAAILNLLFWGCLALHLFRRRWEVLRWVAALVLVPLLAVAASLTIKTLVPQAIAVIVPQEVDVRAGNREDAVVRFQLHAGTEVRLVETRGNWLRLELPDGQQGWLETEHVERVTF